MLDCGMHMGFNDEVGDLLLRGVATGAPSSSA